MIQYNPTRVDGDNHVRYTIEQGEKNRLFVIGLNPSTADICKADPTMRRVVGFVNHFGYDGYVMLNLYPLRATSPNTLPCEADFNEHLHCANLTKIAELLKQEKNPTILAAFGNNIGKRRYLRHCWQDIIEVAKPYQPQWKCLGSLTKLGNPRHPLYIKGDTQLSDLEV